MAEYKAILQRNAVVHGPTVLHDAARVLVVAASLIQHAGLQACDLDQKLLKALRHAYVVNVGGTFGNVQQQPLPDHNEEHRAVKGFLNRHDGGAYITPFPDITPQFATWVVNRMLIVALHALANCRENRSGGFGTFRGALALWRNMSIL